MGLDSLEVAAGQNMQDSQDPLDRVEASTEFVRTGDVRGGLSDEAEPTQAAHGRHPAFECGQDVQGRCDCVMTGALP